MKKLLITLLFLTVPLMGDTSVVLPKTNPAVVPPAAKKLPATEPAPVKPPVAISATAPTQVAIVDEEEEDDEAEALPAAVQIPTPAKGTEPAELTTPAIPSNTSATAESGKEELPEASTEDTRSLAVFNRTGRTITLYGKSADNSGRLLATFKTGDAPAQMITIPTNIDTLYVQDPARSTLLPLDEGVKLVTIAIASSVGTFTYTLNSIAPEYGEHVTIYNATDNDQIVIMKTSAKVPGLFSFTTATQSYAYTIPAQTMLLITIPQLALPATQDKKVQCGLPNSETPLTINSNEQNMFIVTQDNRTPALHKI